MKLLKRKTKGRDILKKIISLFLIISICLSFSACGNSTPTDKNDISKKAETTEQKLDEHTEAIIGVWKSTSFFMLTFNEDKTGTYLHEGKNNDFTWNYDEKLSCYTFASPSLPTTINIFMKSENGINYLECTNAKLYREKDFKKVLDEYLDECRADLAKEYDFNASTKIDFQKPYIAGDLIVTFTELAIENNEMNLYIEVTNNGTTNLESIPQNLLEVGFKYKYYSVPSPCYGMGIGFNFSFVDDRTAINPGETAVMKANISNGKITNALTVLGTVIGFSTCTIDGDYYYIDLGEYTIK